MKIRALTGFLDPGWPLESEEIAKFAACLSACQKALEKLGYEVQTLRLAGPPPLEMIQPVPIAERVDLACALEAECFVHGIDYVSIGPVLPEEPDACTVIPKILGATENVFASAILADPASGLSLEAAQTCAQAIKEASALTSDGFANLRFATLANVPACAPFFPAAYHRGGAPGFAIATESADLALAMIRESDSLQLARKRLVATIENQAGALTKVARRIAAEYEVQFFGVDFSLAPFPEAACSIGAAFEAMGVPAVGLAGTAAAAAFLADTLDRAQFQRTGFCGLFFPILEDSVLAARAAEGTLTIYDVLLYCTVCGTGLDTIPLPGDTSAEALAAVLLDLGALALRHNKPLTARLMPIPGKVAGDEVHFNFPYFADSHVMAIPAQALSGMLGAKEMLDIGPHGS
jgi:uncharacterized protein (UPF0210 family)